MTKKIHIPNEADQVRAMMMLLEAHEANVDRDFEAVYKLMRTFLNTLTITEAARAEAYRQHAEFLAKRKADREARGQSSNEALLERLTKRLSGEPIPPIMPEPETTPVEPTYDLPTKKMRRALDTFDALPDEEQANSLAGLWKADEGSVEQEV